MLGHCSVITHLFQYAEDGADAHIDFNVARTIEWVKHQQVFALRITIRHHVDTVHLFRCHSGQVTAPFIGFNQYIVGNDVEFLLDLTLYVFASSRAHDIAKLTAQCAFVDGMANAFASASYHFKQ